MTLINLLISLIMSVVSAKQGHALTPNIELIPLSPLTCEADCIVRLDEHGQIYMLKDQTTLVVVEEMQTQEFFIPSRGITRDFMPFANGLILFHDRMAAVSELSLYNTITHELTITKIKGSFSSCYINYFQPHGLIMMRRIGDDHVLLCGSTSVMLARITSQSFVIEESLKVGMNPSPAVHSVYDAATSNDHKLYIMPLGYYPLVAAVVPNYKTIMFPDQLLVLRYDLSTKIWDYLVIEAPKEIEGTLFLSIRFVGVDQDGQLYFSYEWKEEEQSHFLLYSYNETGHINWFLSEEDFGGVVYHTFLLGPDDSITMMSQDGALQTLTWDK